MNGYLSNRFLFYYNIHGGSWFGKNCEIKTASLMRTSLFYVIFHPPFYVSGKAFSLIKKKKEHIIIVFSIDGECQAKKTLLFL